MREEHMWVNVDWTVSQVSQPPEPSVEMVALLELVDLTNQIQRDRLQSSLYHRIVDGGFGTWDAICRRQDIFAAPFQYAVAVILSMLKRCKIFRFGAFMVTLILL